MNHLQKIDFELIQDDSVFDRFKNGLSTFSTLRDKDEVILSVSGGLDSMALFALIYSVKRFKITVAHVNHNFRYDSQKDQELVQSICQELGISFFSVSLDPDKIKKGESVEKWARDHRYTFLLELSNKTNDAWVMTGHHMNDQAETILMNLSRQSGISGLRGFAKENGKILRPLFHFNKQDLIEFVKRNSISFREDSTNSDLSIPRNFLRQTILEPWKKKVPSLLKGIQGSVEHFIEWMDALDHFIYHNLVPKVIQSDNQFQIQLNEIKTMPNMTKVRLVQILLKEYDNAPWTKHEIEQLKTFFQNDEIGHQHILPNGWKILKDRDSIFGQKMPKEMEIKGVELMPGHPVDFDKYRYELHVLKLSKYDSTLDNEKVDWTLLKGQKLELRIWENGDSFQPLGMDGHQKISDFLTNEKVNRFAKENQAVLTANGTIVWVCGKRIADWVKLTPNTTETAILNRSQLLI